MGLSPERQNASRVRGRSDFGSQFNAEAFGHGEGQGERGPTPLHGFRKRVWNPAVIAAAVTPFTPHGLRTQPRPSGLLRERIPLPSSAAWATRTSGPRCKFTDTWSLNKTTC